MSGKGQLTRSSGRNGRIVMAAIVMAFVMLALSACHRSVTGPRDKDTNTTQPPADSSFKPPIQSPGSWQMGAGRRIAGSVKYASITTNGLIMSCSDNDTTYAFNIVTGANSKQYSPQGCSTAPSGDAAGTFVTAGLDNSKLARYDANGNTCVMLLPSNEPRTVWATDNGVSVVGGQRGSVNAFDPSCRLNKTLTEGNGTPISAIAYRDGMLSYSVGSGPITIIDSNWQTQAVIATDQQFSGTQTVRQMMFSPQHQSLALIRNGANTVDMFSTDPNFAGYKFGGLQVKMEAGFQPETFTFCEERRTLVVALNDGSAQSRIQVWDPMVPTQVNANARQTFEAHLIKEWPSGGRVIAIGCDTQGQRMTVVFANGMAQDYVPRLSNAR